MKQISLLLLAILFIATNAFSEQTVNNHGPVTGRPVASRVQWKELSQDSVGQVFFSMWKSKVPGVDRLKSFDLRGEFELSYFVDPRGTLGGGGSTVILNKVRYELSSLDKETKEDLAAVIRHLFPATAPFEKESRRTVTLDFRMVSDGNPDKVRAFVSLKPTRDVKLECNWSDGGDVSASLTLSEDLKKLSLKSIVKGLNLVPQTIPDEVKTEGDVKYLTSDKNQRQISATWPNASLLLTQSDGFSTAFEGEFKIGASMKKVSCSVHTND